MPPGPTSPTSNISPAGHEHVPDGRVAGDHGWDRVISEAATSDATRALLLFAANNCSWRGLDDAFVDDLRKPRLRSTTPALGMRWQSPATAASARQSNTGYSIPPYVQLAAFHWLAKRRRPVNVLRNRRFRYIAIHYDHTCRL
ncbi:hypothetical protein Q7P37_009575 [Cladosporium fusiforme]